MLKEGLRDEMSTQEKSPSTSICLMNYVEFFTYETFAPSELL